MKRKKWTEEEEETLISEYSCFLSSGALAKLQTREKKFRPITDRVNALHHLRDPAAFPFRWSWRDVSVKIQNMRHQYLGVKHKILLPRPPSSSSTPTAATTAADFDWDNGVHLWSNFLRYKQVFGDIHLDLSSPKTSVADAELDLDSDAEGEDEELGADEDGGEAGEIGEDEEEFKGPAVVEVENSGPGGSCGPRGGKMGYFGRRVVELAKTALRREEERRAREAAREEEEYARGLRRRAREHRWEMEAGATRRWEEEHRERWRRREERREEEEMEWRERMMMLQMEQEKQAMQMHADACQAQMQTLGILVRLVCQFLGNGAGGNDGGLPHQVGHSLQQQHQQHSSGSLAGEDGKNDSLSGNSYL